MKRVLEETKRWLRERTLGQKTAIIFGSVVLFWIIAGIGVAMIPMNDWLVLLGFLGVIAAVVLDLLWCRCPHCGRYLRWSILGVEYCPGCGEKLDKKE